MARGHQVEFANLILHAGSQELLDLVESLLWPALTSGERRIYGKTDFFFESITPMLLEWDGVGQVVISGRFVKTVKLEREQYFDEAKGLIADRETMDSAPSAIFVFTLASHKLTYLHETNHAPSLGQFELTLRRLVELQYQRGIRERYQDEREAGLKTTLVQLRKDFPEPTVDVVPFTFEGSVDSFIDSFKSIYTIRAKLIRPNNEIDLNPMFAGLREEGDRLGAERTVISQHSRDGMMPEETKAYVKAAAQGNSKVEVRGVDEAGGILKGNNHDFSLKRVIKTLPQEFIARVRLAFEEFKKAVGGGDIAAVQGAAPDDDRILQFAKSVESEMVQPVRARNGS